MTHQNQPVGAGERRLGIGDAVGIAVFCILLLTVSYLHSLQRMFWSDEIMGWLVITQPHWHGLLHLWNAGIDSSGIWYYVLGRPWIAIFGSSELSLREFSAAGIAGSGAVIWLAARRYYALLPVAAAVFFAYVNTLAMMWQIDNARCYGIFLLASSIVVYLLLRDANSGAVKPSPLFLLGTFAAYAFLCGSHILGALYAGAFLAMQIAFDLCAHRLRPRLYVSAALSFVVVLFSKANLQSTAALGKPTYWTVRPALRKFYSPHVLFDQRVLNFTLLLLLVVVLYLRYRKHRLPVYLLGVGFLGLDMFIRLYSHFATSIFVDRYLLPFTFIAVLAISEILTQIAEAETYLHTLRAVAIPLIILCFTIYSLLSPSSPRPPYPQKDYTNPLLAMLPSGIPVISADPGIYVDMNFYHPHGEGHALYFPVDWETSLDRSNLGGVSGFHEMDNFKATGIYADGIQPSQQILDKYRDFAVFTTDEHSAWFQRRIRENPEFAVTAIGSLVTSIHIYSVWLVHHR